MLWSTIQKLVLIVLLFTPQAFAADLIINSNDATWSIGRIEFPLQASGGSETGYAWSVTSGSLPPGMSLRTDIPGYFPPGTTGGVIGVATTPGTYIVTFQVKDSANNTATKAVTFKVLGFVMTSDIEFSDASVGVPCSKPITVAGTLGTVSFTVTDGLVPPGLALNPTTGVIAGTPTSAGDYSFNVDITDSTGTINRNLRIHVSELRIETPASLPAATQGIFYSQAITAAGGTGMMTFSSNCCLPPGISLSGNGILSGTPGSPGVWGFTLEIQDAAGARLRRHLQLGVAGNPVGIPGQNPPRIDDITIGDYVAWNFMVNDGTPPSTWSVVNGSLPPGMTLIDVPDPRPFWNFSGAQFSGTPTTAGEFNVTLRATDSSAPAFSTDRAYSLHCSILAADGIPNPQYGIAYHHTIRIVGGEAPYTFEHISGDLPSGLTLDSSGLISGSLTETGGGFGFFIKVTDKNGNTLTRFMGTYVDTIPVNPVNITGGRLGDPVVNQYRNWALNAWGGSGSYNWTLESGSSLPAGLALSGSPAAFVNLSGNPTTIGKYTFTLRAVDVSDPANFALRTFYVNVTPIALSVSPNLPWANAGSAYSTTLNVTGNTGSVIWTVDTSTTGMGAQPSLPSGMSLTQAGVLSGTPQSAGQYWFRIRATDAVGATSLWDFSITVYPAGQTPPLFITSGDPTFRLGWLEWSLSASGGTGHGYTWSVIGGSLPTGVVIRSDWPQFAPGDSGLVGIATDPGTYNFTLRVTDSGGKTATRAFAATILPIVVVTNWEMQDASFNTSYDQKILAVKRGGGALTFSLQDGATLPPGLTLSGSGRISGTPTLSGTYGFNVLITDGVSTVDQYHQIHVSQLFISTPENLPTAIAGVPYSQAISVSGGTGPYGFSMGGCCPPGGLGINPATGTLSGILGPGYYSLEINVQDALGAWVRKVFKLSVAPTQLNLPAFTSNVIEDFTVGGQTWYTLGTNGGTPPYTWSLVSGSLPEGISITAPNVASPFGGWRGGLIIGGTATTPGLYPFTLRVTDSSTPAQTADWPYTLRVAPVAFGGIPNGTFGVAYNAQIPILGGAPPFTASVTGGEVPEGLSINSAGQVSGTPKVTGNYWFQLRVSGAAGEVVHGNQINIGGTTSTWIEINPSGDLGEIMAGSPWNRQLAAWGGTQPYNWTVESGSALPAGLSLSADGLLSGAMTELGLKTFLIRATDKDGNFGVRRISVNNTPINIQGGGGLPYANVGSAYNHLFVATGGTGAITWSIAPGSILPQGLTLNPDGTLTGNPTYSGQVDFTLLAADSAGMTNRRGYSLPVYPAGAAPPLYINMDVGDASIGRFDRRLEASGGTGTGYSFSLAGGVLPPGLAIENQPPLWVDGNGMPRLSGNATNLGTYNFTLQLNDSGGHTVTKAMTVRIVALVFTNDTEFPDASVSTPYSKSLTVAGATGTVTFALQQGQMLPPGLTLNTSTGVISGIPTTAGHYWFQITASDSLCAQWIGINLNVSPMKITSSTDLPNGAQGVAYLNSITVAGGTPPYTFSHNCCTPGGISLNPQTGELSGTSYQFSTWAFSVTVTDSNGWQLRKQFRLAILPVPVVLPSIDSDLNMDLSLGQYQAWDIHPSAGTPPYTWTQISGTVPPGMILETAAEPRPGWAFTGAWLAGTPVTAGSYTFAVKLSDSVGLYTQRTYTIKVVALGFDNPPGGTFGTAYSDRIRILGGSEPYVVEKVSGHLMTGMSLSSTGQLTGIPGQTGGVGTLIRITDHAGQTYTTNLNFNAGTNPPSSIGMGGGDLGYPLVNSYQDWGFGAGGGSGNYNWTIEPGSTVPPGLSLLGSTGPGTNLSGTLTTPGEYAISLRATDVLDAKNFAVWTYHVTVTPLQLNMNTNLPWVNVNGAINQLLPLTGNTGPVIWTVEPGSNMPDGLSVVGGVLTGTVVVPGQYWFSLRATDAAGSTAVWGFSLPVYPTDQTPPLYIDMGPNLGAVSIGPYQTELRAQGGNGIYSWNVVDGSLPNGVLIRPDKPSWFSQQASGGLIGVATTPGTYNFTLRVTSAGKSLDKAFTLKVVAFAAKDPGGLPDAFANKFYTHTFAETGGSGSMTWSLAQGNPLPQGLSLTAAGVLSGTPTIPGTYNFTVQVSDGTSTIGHGVSLVVQTINVTITDTINNRTTDGRILWPLTQGNAVGLRFEGHNGTGPYTWHADWLPPGLVMQTDGTITGTATNAGTWSFPVTVTDSGARFYRAWYSLNVAGVPAILPSINGFTGDASLGIEWTAGYSVSGGKAPYCWSASGLPPGVSLVSFLPGSNFDYSNFDAYGAILVGRPMQLGTFNVAITLTEGCVSQDVRGVSTTQIFPIRVVEMSHDNDIFPSFPTRGENYDATIRIIGGALPYTWSISSGTLPAGLTMTRDPNTYLARITGKPLENGNICPGILVTDANSNTYNTGACFGIGGGTTTINVNNNYNLGYGVANQWYYRELSASGAPSYAWSLENDLSIPPEFRQWPAGLTLSSAGVISGTPNVPGIYKFLVRATDAGNPANYGIRQLILTVTPLHLTSGTNLGWTNKDAVFAYTPAITGATGPLTWSVAQGSLLPPGLSLNPATGTISGTLGSAGNYNFNLNVAEPSTNSTQAYGFNISVYPPGKFPPVYLNFGPDLGTLSAVSAIWGLQAGGGKPPYVYTFAPGATPIPGMRVQTGPPFPTYFSTSTTGGFFGVVTAPGSYSTTIRVTDSQGEFFDRTVTLRISPLTHMANDWLPRATVNSSYNYQFKAAGLTGSALWSLQPGSTLPPGFSLVPDPDNLTVRLTGTPSAPGTYNFRLQVTDSLSNSLSWNFNIEVMPFSITNDSVLPYGSAGAVYDVTLTAQPDVTITNWAMHSGGLPSGLSLDAGTGRISGTPSGQWYQSFTVRATDSTGRTSLKNFSLIIRPSSPAAIYINMSSQFQDTVMGRTWWSGLYASGGTPPYQWEVAGGSSLPPGLELVNDGNQVTNWSVAGISYLSGRPTVPGDYSFILKVTDSLTNTAVQEFTLHVATVSTEYDNLPLGGTQLLYGVPYAQQLLGIGGTGGYVWTAEGTLPSGLALDAAGLISGTPYETGNFSIPVRLTDLAGATIRRNLNLNIGSGTSSQLYINQGSNLGIVSQASAYSRDFSASGSPLPVPNYLFTAMSALPPGCALLTGDAQVNSNPARLACNFAAPGTYNFTLRVQDAAGNLGVRLFTLRVTADMIFTNVLRDASTAAAYSQRLLAWGAGTWSVAPGSALPAGLSLSQDGVLSGTPANTGPASFILRFTDASGNYMARSYTMNVTGLVITSPELIPVKWINGVFNSYTFIQEGAASAIWSFDPSYGLPTGLTLSPDGVLSGTTADEWAWTISITATSGSTAFTKRFLLIVMPKYPNLLRSSSTSPILLGDLYQGQSMQYTLANYNGTPPYAWAAAPGSSLPPGLGLVSGNDLPISFNRDSTLLAGTATTPGQYSFTLRLSDAAGKTTERTFMLNVSAMSIATNSLRIAGYNLPYSQTLTAVGGTPPYTFTITAGALPPGVNLSQAGVISGIPTNTGNWGFTVKATDATAMSYARTLTLTVYTDPARSTNINISTAATLSDLYLGQGRVQSLSAGSGTAPYTWTKISGSLPPGIDLVTGAAIGMNPANTYLAGRTTSTGVWTFTLRAADSAPNQNIAYKTFTWRVTPLQVTPYTLPVTFMGAPVNIGLAAIGGTPPYTYALQPGAFMPPGLTLSLDGRVAGALTQTGIFTIPFIVTDSTGLALTTSRSITGYPAGATIPLQVATSDYIDLGGPVNPLSLNQDTLQALTVVSGVTPVQATITSGSLPLGTSFVYGPGFSSTYLTGTPSSGTVGNYSLTVSATDGAGQSLGNIKLTASVIPLGLLPDPLPPPAAGVPYSATFAPSGGKAPYSLQLVGTADCPPGLALSGMTLSGIPTTPGQYRMTVILRDSDQLELRRGFTLFVDAPASPLKALSSSPSYVQVTVERGINPAPVPINLESGSYPQPFTVAVAGIAGASLTASSGTAPQTISLILPNNLALGTYYGVIEVNAPQAPNSPLGIRVIVKVVDPPPCTFVVNPLSASVGSGLGTGSLTVTSASYCGWAPVASQPWITIDSPGPGSGNGTVTYSITANPDQNSRVGTIAIQDPAHTTTYQSHTITQFGATCAYTIDPVRADVPAAGGNGSITVNTSLGSCSWTAVSHDSWIHILNGASGTGTGSLTLSVDEKTTVTGRTGTVTVAGQIFTVSQAGADCMVTLSAASADVAASGGDGSVDVTTNGCSFSTAPPPSWITIISGGFGSASGTLRYTIAPNSSTQARSATLVIGGQPYQILQAGVGCSFTLGANDTHFGSGPGAGSITVTANGSNCGWTASTLSSSPWLKITSGTPGIGNGAVSYQLLDNSGTAQSRTDAIVVAGQTVTITQSGAVCSYELRASGGSVPAGGGTATAGVISVSGCSWVATSNASWLSIISFTGNGSGDVTYAASPNTGAFERTGTLTIAGRLYMVTQAGAPCSYTLSSDSAIIARDADSATFNVTSAVGGCTPAPVSFANWIIVTSTVPSGAGWTVMFSVLVNPNATERSGLIQVGDKVFTVKQQAALCSYSLNAYGAIFDKSGGDGAVLASASALGCTLAPNQVGSSPEVALGTLIQDAVTKIWTQPYAVPQFNSFNLWIRVLEINISGEIFTIKQTSW